MFSQKLTCNILITLFLPVCVIWLRRVDYPLLYSRHSSGWMILLNPILHLLESSQCWKSIKREGIEPRVMQRLIKITKTAYNSFNYKIYYDIATLNENNSIKIIIMSNKSKMGILECLEGIKGNVKCCEKRWNKFKNINQ